MEMIIKPYQSSRYKEALFALTKRLPKTHYKYGTVLNEYRQMVAGDIGEEIVMKVLENLSLPYPYYIFHNIALNRKPLFQMDVLMITPYFVLILEVKNIKGQIILTENPQQMIRTTDTGEKHAFDSPLLQLDEYKFQLELFLQSLRINLPIYTAVVFPTPTHITSTPRDKVVLIKREILPFVRSLPSTQPLISSEQLSLLKEEIKKSHQDFMPTPLTTHFAISPESIIRGVECLVCGAFPMRRFKRTWHCEACGRTDPHAHQSTLRDYFYLFDSSISNKECRDFLLIKDIHLTTRLLRQQIHRKTGCFRSTRYHQR